MGWSTELFCNISFNRESFNSKYEVQDKIDEIKKCLEYTKDKIKNLAIITEPNKFCPEDYEPMSWIQGEVRENLELIEEYTIDIYKLELLLENWDVCHNEEGLAIDFPEGITLNTAFLEGDFVNSVKYPKANV